MTQVNSCQIVPVLLRGILGCVFVIAGLMKLLSPLAFIVTLRTADWLPRFSEQILPALLPSMEIALGLALIIGWKVKVMAICSVFLIAAFTGFLTIEWIQGNTTCSCFGDSGGAFAILSTGKVIFTRNGLLLFLAVRLAHRQSHLTNGA